MLVINYSLSFKALDSYVQTFNSSRELLSLHVRQSVSATAKDMLRIYGIVLAKADGISELKLDNLPPLRTNNVQLAGITQTSPRTIQRHINRLLEAGVIEQKNWRGSNADYELFINPKILSIRCRKMAKELQLQLKSPLSQRIENETIQEVYKTTCPHTDTGNNSYNSNNIIIAVDKPVSDTEAKSEHQHSGYKTGNNTGHIYSGYTGEKSAENSNRAGEKAGEKVRTKRAPGQWSAGLKTDGPDPARSASLNIYTTLLWSFAKSMLYCGVFLTDRQCDIAKILITRWYELIPSSGLSKAHQQYLERISLVRKFVQKAPDKRFVQLPYQYFDPQNPNGFAGTKKWWLKHHTRKKQVQSKLILQAQIRRFIQNEHKESSKQKPPLQLYLECETRIDKLKDPELLKEFHAAVLSPHVYLQLYKNNPHYAL